MNKSVILCASAIMSLLLISSIVGCQQEPRLTIMVESNTVKAGSSFIVSGSNLKPMVESNTVEVGSFFIVSGSNFKPNQKVWVNFQYQVSDGGVGIQANCEADENGSIHPIIDIPEDVVPGDYEIEISTGKNIYDRELIATLPIRIKGDALY